MGEVILHPKLVERLPWADLPIVFGRAPTAGKERIALTVSRPFILGNLNKNNRTPIYSAWVHLAGVLPKGLPNLDYLDRRGIMPTFTTLENAHACFRGVERPANSELDGASIFIYCIKVPLTLRWNNTPPVSVPSTRRLDDSILLTVLVSQGTNLQQASEPVWGTVLKLEFVETAPNDSWLPIDYENRYDERVW